MNIEFAEYLKILFLIIFSLASLLTFIYKNKIKFLYLKFIRISILLFIIYLIILNINSKYFDFKVVSGIFATLLGAITIAFLIAFLSELKENNKKEK